MSDFGEITTSGPADDPASPSDAPPAVLPRPDVAPRPDGADLAQMKPAEGWAVILFNDDTHDMLEVVMAIVIATGYEHDIAWSIMMRAHQSGKAVVTIAEKKEAEGIASVLRTAKLTVEIKAV